MIEEIQFKHVRVKRTPCFVEFKKIDTGEIVQFRATKIEKVEE